MSAAVLRPRGRVPRWPLAGRDAEIAQVVRLLRDPRCRAVVIAGAAGVGKSRLAAEAAARFSVTHAVVWVYATQAAQGLPLGAVAPLLPPELPEANPLAWAAKAIVDRAQGRPILLVVDDAHVLDPASAVLVHQLSRQITVLATVRTGEPCPDAVTALWRDDASSRVDVTPLDRAGTAAVVNAALEGPVPVSVIDRLHFLSQGNVLFLVELVAAAIHRGDDGAWRLCTELLPGSRLTDLVEQRMGELDADERTVLELVALGEPAGLPELTGMASAEPVESAEARGLIRLGTDDGGIQVRLAHPLFGEVIRAHMPRLRTRRHYQDLAEAMEARGSPRRPEDTLRIAMWRLESGTARDPAPLVAACRLAWVACDYPLAVRLGEGALGCGGGVEAAIILATVLNYTDRPQEAEAVLAQVWNLPCGDRQRTELTLSRAWNLGFGLGRIPEAEQLIRQTRHAVTGTSLRQDLTVLLVQMTGSRGDLEAAMKINADLLTAPATAAIRAQALNAHAIGTSSIGRYGEALAAIRSALDDLDAWRDAVPTLTIMLHINWWMAALAQGDLAGAQEAIDSLKAAMPRLADWDLATNTLTVLSAHLAITRGRPSEAARLLRDVAVSEAARPPSATGITHHCLATYALACALTGDHATAQEAAAAAARAAGQPAALYAPELDVTMPWVAVAAGELTSAVDLALQAAASCREKGLPRFETLALHTLVRLGAADKAAQRLAELADAQDGPLAQVCAEHAFAAARSDGIALEEVSRRFEGLQMILHASEAAAQAAQAHASTGRSASARAASARAWTLAARCQGATTPALARLRAPGLTPREYEIARLAASDLTNRQIAQRLVVSERTVENHLRASYSKLGVNSRKELKPLISE